MESIMMWFTGRMELVRRLLRQNARIAELHSELENTKRYHADALRQLQEANDESMRWYERYVDLCEKRYYESQEWEAGNYPNEVHPAVEADYIDQVIQAQVDRHDEQRRLEFVTEQGHLVWAELYDDDNRVAIDIWARNQAANGVYKLLSVEYEYKSAFYASRQGILVSRIYEQPDLHDHEEAVVESCAAPSYKPWIEPEQHVRLRHPVRHNRVYKAMKAA